MTDKQEKSSDNEMTFFEHIDALRPHLVRGFSALFIIMIVAFVAKKFIIDMVLFHIAHGLPVKFFLFFVFEFFGRKYMKRT